jgi:hypothetical protein
LGQLGQALAIATARAETGTNISPTVAQRGQELAKAVPSVPTVVGAGGHYQAANDSAKAAVEAVLGATTPTVAVQQDGSVAGVNGNNDSTDTEPADTLSDTGGTGVKSGTISCSPRRMSNNFGQRVMACGQIITATARPWSTKTF